MAPNYAQKVLCVTHSVASTLTHVSASPRSCVPLRLQIRLAPAAQVHLWQEHFARPDKGGSMLRVPAQGLNYVALRGLLVANLSFSAGSKPVALRFRVKILYFTRSKADSSLIHLFTSVIDQQVSENI